jgi:thioredoxin 1
MEFIKNKGKKKKMDVEPVHVTDSNFNEIVKKNPLVLIDFWASWCGPCRALTPTIEELAKEYEGKILIGKLNVDENPDTAECFQVFSIPTLIMVKDGCEVDRIVGLVPKKHIETVLKKHLG